jgi:hypothetical protein
LDFENEFDIVFICKYKKRTFCKRKMDIKHPWL